MRLLKSVLLLLFVIVLLNGCWAPRCPITTCRTTIEHRHNDTVSGIFSGKAATVPPLHFLWDKKKGEVNTEFKGESRKKRKLRKKFPWERW